MKLRILRPYLDYEVGKSYNIDVPAQARYMIAMSIAKEVVSKDGKEVDDIAPAPVKKQEKKAVKPVSKKAAVKPAENDDDLS